MYENYTYDYILDSILNRVREFDSTIDVREGSAIWYAVSPVAMELAIAYSNCDMVNKESFVGTATREGIYLACEDIGLDTSRFDATASVFLADFNVEVSIGSRWSCSGYTLRVTERVGEASADGVKYYQYRLVCETTGSASQYITGNLTPITEYGSNGLQMAVIDMCISAGAEETPDEEVRATYFDYIANKSEGANIAQYNQWLNEFESTIGRIGAHKIRPTWDGVNTVKVVILDGNKESPDSTLVDAVQDYLDPNSEGLGEGKAPIGAVVTVEGGVNADIDIKAEITTNGENVDISDINERITEYFREIAFRKSVVNIYEVAGIILASPSVSNVNSVEIGRWNGVDSEVSYSPTNLPLDEFETPVLHEFYTV